MSAPCYFVTGTDTEVGKTFCCAALLSRAGSLGLRTSALKPVAAGAVFEDGQLRNEDALTLMKAINQPQPYGKVNPICLEAAIAPHIAARSEGVDLDVKILQGFGEDFRTLSSDFALIEGAGGWLVPLNDRETLGDFAGAMALPVILVVGMRLGCISHALLTARAVASQGLRLAGWVANQLTPEPMSRYRENLETLKSMLPAPLLGEVPYIEGGDFQRAAADLVLPDGLEGRTHPR